MLRGINLILSSILTLLGFESCVPVCEYGPEPPVICEYGVPTATYVFKGKVTNPQGAAVEGERFIIRALDDTGGIIPYPYYNDTLYTDMNGKIHKESYDYPKTRYRFVVEDPMGKYETDSVDVMPKQVEKGDGNWYDGKFEVSADFQLREKGEND